MSNLTDRSPVLRSPTDSVRPRLLSRLNPFGQRTNDWDNFYPDDLPRSGGNHYFFTLCAAIGILLMFGGICTYVGIWISGAELRWTTAALQQSQQAAAAAQKNSDANLLEVNRIKACINRPPDGKSSVF